VSDLLDAMKASLADAEANKDQWQADLHEAALKDPNNMRNWFPKVIASGVPYPETHFVELPAETWGDFINGKPTERTISFVNQLKALCCIVGYPCFLRGTMMSAKHSWKDSCFIESEATNLHAHVYSIIETNEMAWGAFKPTAFAVRKMIPTVPAFYAFWGKMPVTKERRYFIKDGKVVCHHPYWPELSIEQPTPIGGFTPRTDNWWVPLLALLNEEPEEEVRFLTQLAEMIGTVISGSWSVDFLQADDGSWFCIDMAVAEESFHWPWCPNAPESMKRYLEPKPDVDYEKLIKQEQRDEMKDDR